MIKFMKIDREDVRHLAELARLKLTETELEKFKKEATEIVGFFDELGGVGEREGEEREEEADNVSEAVNDEERENRGTGKEREQFREKKDGFLKIPKVFSEDA